MFHRVDVCENNDFWKNPEGKSYNCVLNTDSRWLIINRLSSHVEELLYIILQNVFS